MMSQSVGGDQLEDPVGLLTRQDRSHPDERRSVGHRLQLHPGDLRADAAESHEGAEAAVGARDDPLRANDRREALEARGPS
jgi:hypothetical protein